MAITYAHVQEATICREQVLLALVLVDPSLLGGSVIDVCPAGRWH